MMEKWISASDLKCRIPAKEFYLAELPTMPSPRGGGWRDGGLCPFHRDKHAGSFRVNLDTGGFTCFSCGSKGADIVAFIRLRDVLSFPEALQKLAAEWGLA